MRRHNLNIEECKNDGRTISERKTKKDKYISEETLELAELRGECIKVEEHEDVKFLTNVTRKNRKKDKERAALETLTKDLGVKDRWIGTKQN